MCCYEELFVQTNIRKFVQFTKIAKISCVPNFVALLCFHWSVWLSSVLAAVCKHGRHGYNCVEECTCLNGATCHHRDGSCTCAEGFENADCSQGEHYPLKSNFFSSVSHSSQPPLNKPLLHSRSVSENQIISMKLSVSLIKRSCYCVLALSTSRFEHCCGSKMIM